MFRTLIPFAAALMLGVTAAAQDAKQETKQAPAAPAAKFVQKPELYPLDTCIVSGEKLDAKAVAFTVGGVAFKTCCEKCKAKVEKDPAAFAKKMEAALIAAQIGHYPLATCAISGAKLGSMGKPVQHVLEGTLVQLCCSHCNDKLLAKPADAVAKVRQAAFDAQSKSYPLDACIVSGEKLGKDAVSVMFGTTLVRFCCENCIAKFEQDPAQYLAKFHPAKAGDKPAEPKKDAK